MIAWEESGSGLPIVLVHGITEDRRVWDRVIPLLDDQYRCVRLDLRGHGESPMDADLSALAMAEDIGEVVRAAGRDERSTNPASPSSSKRVTHRWAHWREIPMAFAT